MNLILGLGSNLGDKRENLEQALAFIKNEYKATGLKISSVYETMALQIKDDLKGDWDLPFLNIVISIETNLVPKEILKINKKIESKMGRDHLAPKWAPRTVDIDILFLDDQKYICTDIGDELIIPHSEILNRDFVLSPLLDIAPDLSNEHFFNTEQTLLKLIKSKEKLISKFMAVLNLTPDSFSDGGLYLNSLKIKDFLNGIRENSISIIDIGAESTRPDAEVLNLDEEWQRLSSFFEIYENFFQGKNLKPKLSLDSRNYETIKRAIHYGINIINDVSGLADERILELLTENENIDYVLMHSLSVPADPKITLKNDDEVIEDLISWFKLKLELFVDKGISLNRIFIDPGIGFGKTAWQSKIIIKNIKKFECLGCRILVGHSRKSFFNPISNHDFKDRDVESLGVSLYLAQSQVDVIRVHQAQDHKRMIKAYKYIK